MLLSLIVTISRTFQLHNRFFFSKEDVRAYARFSDDDDDDDIIIILRAAD